MMLRQWQESQKNAACAGSHPSTGPLKKA